MVGKEEEGRRKKPGKKPVLNPRTLSPEPSVLSIRPRRPAKLIFLKIAVLPGLNLKLWRVVHKRFLSELDVHEKKKIDIMEAFT